MRIESSAFHEHGEIPQRYTCEGADVSPPLSFAVDDVRGARSLALIVDDSDAPRATWVHWVVYNLAAATTSLPENVGGQSLPKGAQLGTNSWNRIGWGGPCPPHGTHRYVFTLYALDAVLPDLAAPTKEQLLRAMAPHILAHARLVGTYALRRASRQPATRA